MESEIFIENILYKEVKSFEPPERKQSQILGVFCTMAMACLALYVCCCIDKWTCCTQSTFKNKHMQIEVIQKRALRI